jgi:hypothetical protein
MLRGRVALTAFLVPLALAVAIVGGCSGASGSAAGVAPTDGAGLVSALCTRCHPATRFEAVQKDRNSWTRTVERMQEHGLTVSDQQKQSIIDYLTKRDGGS